MSYNYLLNNFDASLGYDFNSSELNNSSSIDYERIKNEVNQSPSIKSVPGYQKKLKANNLPNTNSNSFEVSQDNKKFGFSEKLKVLFKNAESKTELSDPYDFSDNDSQCNDNINKALNNVDSFKRKGSTVYSKSNNGTMHKSIMFPRYVTSQSERNNSAEEKDCNNETLNNCSDNFKLNKFGVPMFAPNFVSSNSYQAAYKTQLTAQPDACKVSDLKNGRKTPPVQLPSYNNVLLNNFVAKTKAPSVKPTSIINSLKSNKSSSGKPLGFGNPQAFKQRTSKVEKKSDSKQKTIQKGKSLLNQLQKTAFFNRPSGLAIKKTSTKASFFGMSKNNLQENAEASRAITSNINTTKKSLLEESLLGKFYCILFKVYLP